MIVDFTGAADVFPHVSLNHTLTVTVPAAVTLRLFEVAKISHAVHVAAVLTHIEATPLASVAAIVSASGETLAYSAPPLMRTLPVGASNSGAGRLATVAPADVLPARSMAQTRNVYVEPFVSPEIADVAALLAETVVPPAHVVGGVAPVA